MSVGAQGNSVAAKIGFSHISQEDSGFALGYSETMDLITSTSGLREACARLSQHAYVTVDTEFMRETTYYPKLCLIQMASAEEAVLVDPLAEGIDLAPFIALMADPAVIKVFPAARQEIEIIWLLGQVIPAPLFDTQVAAMVCGFGDQVSYEQLANDLAKARIDKSSRFTDWARRPLSRAQLDYAISDVTHLRVVYEALAARLAETGRETWLAEEMSLLTSPETYAARPEDAWRRLAGRVRRPREIAALIELAAWREIEAQQRDVPRSRILKDDALIEIAIAGPTTPEALAELRSIPRGFERSKSGGDILACIQRAQQRDPATLPAIERERPRGNTGATLDLLKVLLKAVSERERVAPKILASVDDLEAIAFDDEADVRALRGWRRELFGEPALLLKKGRLALAVDRGRVVIVSRGD